MILLFLGEQKIRITNALTTFIQSIELGFLSTIERLARAYGIPVWKLVAPHIPKVKFKRVKRRKGL